MTDDVTATLQAKTEGLSVSVPRPETVRLSAEHHRRVRRVSAGGVAVVSVAALLVALASGVGGQSSTSPAPADTPTTPSHNPSAEADTVPALAAHPLLSEQDWRAITYGPGTRSAAVKGSAMLNGPALTICTPDPRTRLDFDNGYGVTVDTVPTESRAATFRESGRPGTQINEYVMRYRDQREAKAAYAGVYTYFSGCQDPRYGTATFHGSMPQGGGYLADEQFTAEQTLLSAKNLDTSQEDAPPFLYQLVAGRDRNVVIVIESTGAADRTLHTLQMAFLNAIYGGREACVTFCE
jgi:hypothetical protein